MRNWSKRERRDHGVLPGQFLDEQHVKWSVCPHYCENLVSTDLRMSAPRTLINVRGAFLCLGFSNSTADFSIECLYFVVAWEAKFKWVNHPIAGKVGLAVQSI